jgi:tripartite-type tricarboxylate transporter receptor subunit TctC
MELQRRRLLQLAVLSAFSRPAQAQHNYPARPVRLLVGYAAGGPSDAIARLTAQWLSERLGQQVIVENRPGAASNLAAEAVVRSAPDGYTLLYLTISNAVNATLYHNLSFDISRDIMPVASITRSPAVLEVHPSFPAKSVPEFIAYARAHPGKVNLASAGPGSAPHLYAELFKMMTATELTHVHYRGSGPALPDLISGRLDAMFDPTASSIAHIRAGELRPLAVTTATRLEVLPDVPTVGDFVPGYEASGWYGIGVPKDTPAEIVAKLNAEINAALANARMKARFAELGATVLPGSPADFAKLIAADRDKWAKVIRTANITAE